MRHFVPRGATATLRVAGYRKLAVPLALRQRKHHRRETPTRNTVESCDTNILLYYLNRSCPEHERAREYLEPRFTTEGFGICELVLIELYVTLRNPAVLEKPLSAGRALQAVHSFRNNPHWALIDYPGSLMNQIWDDAANARARRAMFDARIGRTLEHHGVTTFATRNEKDFDRFALDVINPIDR